MRLSRGKRPQAAVGAGHRQVSEQRLGACVQGRVTVAAGFLRQDASHRVLAYTGWFQHKYVLGVVRPTPILGPARGSRSCPGHVRRGNRSLREKRWREACCLAAVRVPDSHASSTVDLPAGPSLQKLSSRAAGSCSCDFSDSAIPWSRMGGWPRSKSCGFTMKLGAPRFRS